MKSSSTLLAVGLALSHLGAAGEAHAQSAGEAAEHPAAEKAHKHFNLGVQLYAEGNFGPALAQFRRAYELKPHYKVLYDIAQCNFELRDYVEARAALRRYLAEGGAAALTGEGRAKIDADLAALKRRIARLEVRSNIPGAVVYVDGRRVGTTPFSDAVEVNEGKRTVSVEPAAQWTKQRSILLVGGERQVLTVNFELPSSRPEARTGSSQPFFAPEPSSELGAGFWTASVGALGLAGGALVTGYLALEAQDERRANLNRPGISAAELDQSRREIRRFALTTDGLAAGAVLCAGIATTLFVLRQTETHPGVAVGPDRVVVAGSF